MLDVTAARQPSPDGPFELAGEIDLDNTDAVLRALREHCARTIGPVTVDCAALTFIDSTGLHALFTLHTELERDGRRLVLRDVRPPCARAFELTGLSELLHVDSSERVTDPRP